ARGARKSFLRARRTEKFFARAAHGKVFRAPRFVRKKDAKIFFESKVTLTFHDLFKGYQKKSNQSIRSI
ncbi:hypothetical protein, partial [Pyramidobacter piscolens]|uniref:hypothetical protein n=1 Tax=Pyramidobacter piscolens TaxID=638849 RepID=UPI0028EE3FB5